MFPLKMVIFHSYVSLPEVSPRNKRVKKPQLPSHDPVTMHVQQGKTFTESWLLVVYLPLWKIEKYEFVSWDDDIPNIWKNNPNVPSHQPEKYWNSVPVILFSLKQPHGISHTLIEVSYCNCTSKKPHCMEDQPLDLGPGARAAFVENRWTRRPKWLQTQLNGRNTWTIYPRPTHSYLTTPKNLRVD